MRWLKNTVSIVLALVGVGMILAIGFSNHSADYGKVSIPQGGTVHLPKGTVTVFDRFTGDVSQADTPTTNVALSVRPAAGGEPVPVTLESGGIADTQVEDTERIGEPGAFAKLDVPESGDYVVTGQSDLAPGAVYLELGTNAWSALLDHWKVIAGLLGAALVLALIPVPRRRRHYEDEPHWSTDARAPYAS